VNVKVRSPPATPVTRLVALAAVKAVTFLAPMV